MAEHYMEFSEVIPGITAKEAIWINLFLSRFEDIEVAEADFNTWCAVRGLDPQDDYIIENWPNFDYQIEKNGDLWLHGNDQSFDLDNVVTFVQAFLKEFRPNDIFSMTYASWCSKPRVGEFGGGWAVITAFDSVCGNAYSASDEVKKRLAARVELEMQAKQQSATMPREEGE